ncbi:MAG: metalloregulator ArsR/SmtB family transcription factor [Candidatus Diapherotrites archaeon]|nr:metalloregulator ArsR/SmtB family transcription factor [Candidatus Diapherotrites archaeon]
MKVESFEQACGLNCFEILGNKLRVSIIKSLIKKPKTVQKLCDELKREQSAVSHALAQLRECNFVDYKRKGKEKEYFLKSGIFTKKMNKPLFEAIEEHAKKHCRVRR